MMNAQRKQRRAGPIGLAIAAAGLAAFGLFQLSATEDRAAPVTPLADAGAAQLRWHDGDHLRYAVRLDSSAHLGVAAGGEVQEVSQEISGTLHVRVFAVDGDAVTLGMHLSPAVYAVAGERVPSRERDLATPFVARFDRSGTAHSFRFPPLQERSRALLEEVVRTFQCAVPANAGERWMHEETHAPGRYRAAYVRKADGLHKRKVEYVATGERTIDGTKTRVVESAGRFTLAADASWLQSAVLDDELISVVGKDAMARATTHATLEREVGALSELLATATDADSLLREALARRAAPVTTPEVVATVPASAADIARFHATLDAYHTSAGDDVNLMLALRDLMKQFPELADLVPDVVRKAEIHDRALSGLLHVLELAGHEPAQKALGEIFGDTRISHMNRARAIVALGGIERPTKASLEKLWAAIGNRTTPAATDLSHTALLSIGRLGDVLRNADPARYDKEIRAPLVASLATSPTDESTTIALKAIGNSRDKGLGPELTGHLGAASPAVRAAAAEALGDVDADGALVEMTARLRTEPDGRVRSFLAQGLGKLTATDPKSFATVNALIGDEANGDARFAMARYLVDHIDAYPDGYETLRGMLAKETEPRILRYIGGKIHRMKR